MARPIWTGSISFGLVSVPVALYTATSAHEVSFYQYEKDTTDRIRYQRVNERTGKEVEFGDIVKGTETSKGKLVMLDQDELDAVAPGRSKSLEIHAFVDLDEIDPLYYQKTYFLGPGNDETLQTYALLRDAMTKVNRAAIGTLVMRGKEYLAAIRADDGLLVLETMFFADEVRDPKKEIDRQPGRSKAKPAEVKMAVQLIESMARAWKPADYSDGYTARVKALVRQKAKGGKVKEAEPAPEATGAADLMEVLRSSVEAAKKRRAPAASSKKAAPPASKKAAPPASKKAAPASKKAAPRKTRKKAA
jgi:DNA end-binding protein Ku